MSNPPPPPTSNPNILISLESISDAQQNQNYQNLFLKKTELDKAFLYRISKIFYVFNNHVTLNLVVVQCTRI